MEQTQEATTTKFEFENVETEQLDEVGSLQRKPKLSSETTSNISTLTSDNSSSSSSTVDEKFDKEEDVDTASGGDVLHEHSSIYFDQPQEAESGDIIENLNTEVFKFAAESDVISAVNHFTEEYPASTLFSGTVSSQIYEEAEEASYDVETVLAKQETHDLHCPNCKSCITKRVILTRKRKPQRSLDRARHVKPMYEAPRDVDDSPNVGGNHDDDVFRCLSCFSIFTAAGNCFRSKPSDVTEPLLDSRQVPLTYSSRFWSFIGLTTPKQVQDASLCESTYGVAPVVPATKGNLKIGKDTTISSSETHSNKVTVESHGNYQKTTTVNTHTTEQATTEGTSTFPSSSAVRVNSATKETISSAKDVAISSSEIQHVKEGTAASHVDSQKTTTSKTSWIFSVFPSKKKQTTIEQGVSALNTPLLHKLDGSSEPVANTTPLKNGVSRESTNVKSSKEAFSPINNASTEPLERENDVSSLSIKGSSSVQPSYDTKLVHEVTTASLEVRVESVPIINPGPLLPETGHEVKSFVQLDDIVNCEIKEDKVTIVVVSGTAEASDSRRDQNLVPIQSDTLLQGGREYEANKGWQLEILKSIVYGGLIECITSFGVVSSAAGSGASTLNILVLGMANLVGGLFIIAHNLREMKIASNETITNQSYEQESRYEELLGKPENFRLHAFIAILSFIVFGLVPPVVYGFSFYKSNDHYCKLATALAASIVCIMLLAIGKSHVRKPPKSYIKTLLYYTSIGLAAPGISYVVGDFVSHFIEKLGWFNSGSAATHLFVAKSLNAGFAAY